MMYVFVVSSFVELRDYTFRLRRTQGLTLRCENRNIESMKQQAKRIINKFGGIYTLARKIGAAPSTIYRWTYPLDKGGTGGLIPVKWHEIILETARLEGIFITKEDWSA